MYGWNKKNMLAQSSARPFVIYGYIAFAGVGVMTLTSLPFIRKRIYSLFMISHLIGLAAFLLGLAMHVDDAVPYVAAGGLLYAAEMACRFAKTRVSTAELKVSLPENYSRSTLRLTWDTPGYARGRQYSGYCRRPSHGLESWPACSLACTWLGK